METVGRRTKQLCSRWFGDKRSSQSGLTVVEIVIVVGITVSILMVLVRFLAIGYPLSKTTYLQARSTETARLQLKRIVKMLREARESDTGSYPLAEIGAQKIIFYADVDADDVTERVRLELSGTQLLKGILEPTGDPLEYDVTNETEVVIVANIRNGADPIFTYYSGDYPADVTPLSSSDLGDVKYVGFNIKVDADSAVDPPAVDVQSQVQLRNLKTNLGESVE
jgi:hypothetical protein